MPARPVHQTVPIQVWADVDIGIVHMVRRLNDIPGVRTHASCQGTETEKGPNPYRPYVKVSWLSPEALKHLQHEFDVVVDGESNGTAHPKST